MTKTLLPYLQLARLDKPIGIYLLLWPTLTALWLANEGIPNRSLLFIFIGGVILMRSAGCVINDYADRNLDGHVKRTENRPLATQAISPSNALIFFLILLTSAFLLVLLTNVNTIIMSLLAAALAILYPFMKRYTHLPQVFLGAAFSCAIPMTYTASNTSLSMITALLFLANLSWTVAYDTIYALVDREDDKVIGVRSTAILFGKFDQLMIALLQLLMIISLISIGLLLSLTLFWWLAMVLIGILFAYQHWLIAKRDRTTDFKAFLNNHWVGFILFMGTVFSLWPTL